MPPGRNDACPCGSGRKFKKCCGDPVAVAAAQSAARAPSEIIAGKRDELFELILRFATRHNGKEWLTEAVDVYVDEWYDKLPHDEVQTMLPWALFHWPEADTGASMADVFRDRESRRLSTEHRELLDAEIDAQYSIWEVGHVVPGTGLQLTDRLTGAERFVSDTRTSHDVHTLDTMLARVVDLGGTATFSGIHPSPLQPSSAHAVIAEMKRAFRVRTRPVPIDKLRDPDRQLDLLDLWRSMFEDADTPPTLTNTDGDPMSFVSDRYDFDAQHRTQIVSALLSLPGAEAPAVGRDSAEIILTKPDAGGRRSTRFTVIARIEVLDGRLNVETNSTQRADGARALIDASLGTLVRYRIREETSAAAAMNPEISTRPPSPPDESTPEMRDAVRQFRQEYMLDWLDQSIPALGGLTPRKAAADKRHHKELALLLRDIEHSENRVPIGERIDLQVLRTALGL